MCNLNKTLNDFLDNVANYCSHHDFNETFLRDIEKEVCIPDNEKHDFRRIVGQFLSNLAQKNKKWTIASNPRILRAVKDYHLKTAKVEPPWLLSDTVTRIARTIVDENRWQDTPVLADAIEEIGGELPHLRQNWTWCAHVLLIGHGKLTVTL